MTEPNATLRAVRMGLLMSQDDFARAIRDAGRRAGIDNDANKRLVQRWESGSIAAPRPVYARALEAVTGLPIEALGFTAPVPRAQTSDNNGGGNEDDPAAASVAAQPSAPRTRPAAQGNHSGIWLSRYEYYSSSREATFTGVHYVIVLQHGSRLTVRSLPASAGSTLTMDLSIDGNVITGTWVEVTDAAGYYRGARYHGVIQMLVDPSGRKMSGQWAGFGAEMDINTGPWELVFQDASTNKATVDAYNRRP